MRQKKSHDGEAHMIRVYDPTYARVVAFAEAHDLEMVVAIEQLLDAALGAGPLPPHELAAVVRAAVRTEIQAAHDHAETQRILRYLRACAAFGPPGQAPAMLEHAAACIEDGRYLQLLPAFPTPGSDP